MMKRMRNAPRRVIDRTRLEICALSVLVSHEGEFLLARQVAKECCIPWRRVAFALRRLSESGAVEHQVITYKGQHRSREYTTVYRCCKRPGNSRTMPPGGGFLSKYMNWV